MNLAWKFERCVGIANKKECPDVLLIPTCDSLLRRISVRHYGRSLLTDDYNHRKRKWPQLRNRALFRRSSTQSKALPTSRSRSGERDTVLRVVTRKRQGSALNLACPGEDCQAQRIAPNGCSKLIVKLLQRIGRGERIWTSDPLIPKKGLGCRAECFQSLRVVLQTSQSCSITPFGSECKSPKWQPQTRGSPADFESLALYLEVPGGLIFNL